MEPWSERSLLVPAATSKLSPTAPRSLQQPHCQFDRHSSDPCEPHVPLLLPLENEGEAEVLGGTLTLSTEHGKAAQLQLLPSWNPGSHSPRNMDPLWNAQWQAGKRRCKDTGEPCTAQGSLSTGQAGRHRQQDCPDPPRELKGTAGAAKAPGTYPSTSPGSGGRLRAFHDTRRDS